MPYIILCANNHEEIDRRELSAGPITIGRSLDCDCSVHDILLSRHHCRIEPHGQGWRLIDLSSKNGTRLGWSKITSHYLVDGDQLRMGRTTLTFHAGPFVAAPETTRKRNRLIRPLDPHEALTGTVAGFTFVDPDEQHDPSDVIRDLATPSSPAPLAGKTLVAPESPSSSWDSMVATLSPKTRRPLARPLPMPTEVVVAGRHSQKYRKALSELTLKTQPQLHEVPASATPDPSIPLFTRQDIQLILTFLAACGATVVMWLAIRIYIFSA